MIVSGFPSPLLRRAMAPPPGLAPSVFAGVCLIWVGYKNACAQLSDALGSSPDAIPTPPVCQGGVERSVDELLTGGLPALLTEG